MSPAGPSVKKLPRLALDTMGSAPPGSTGTGRCSLLSIRQVSDRSVLIGVRTSSGRADSAGSMRGPPWVDREGMIEMAALGLLLVIVVIGAVVYIAGNAWLARLDVRQDEAPPPETVRPNLPQSAFVKAPGHIGEVVAERIRPADSARPTCSCLTGRPAHVRTRRTFLRGTCGMGKMSGAAWLAGAEPVTGGRPKPKPERRPPNPSPAGRPSCHLASNVRFGLLPRSW